MKPSYGMSNLCFRQTIFRTLSEITENEPVKHGYGKRREKVLKQEQSFLSKDGSDKGERK